MKIKISDDAFNVFEYIYEEYKETSIHPSSLDIKKHFPKMTEERIINAIRYLKSKNYIDVIFFLSTKEEKLPFEIKEITAQAIWEMEIPISF